MAFHATLRHTHLPAMQAACVSITQVVELEHAEGSRRSEGGAHGCLLAEAGQPGSPKSPGTPSSMPAFHVGDGYYSLPSLYRPAICMFAI